MHGLTSCHLPRMVLYLSSPLPPGFLGPVCLPPFCPYSVTTAPSVPGRDLGIGMERVRIRQALPHRISRQRIVRPSLSGLAEPHVQWCLGGAGTSTTLNPRTKHIPMWRLQPMGVASLLWVGAVAREMGRSLA